MKTSARKHGTLIASAPQQDESSDEALRRGEEEERSQESFEATILRLDGNALELLLRQYGE